MERKIADPMSGIRKAQPDTIVAPATGAGLAGHRRDPPVRAGDARCARGAVRRRAPCPSCRLARRRSAAARAARSRPGAVVSGAGELHRRGHGRAACPWQPRRHARGDRRAVRRCPARGWPSPASSRAAPSRTASSISPRSKAWPISSRPRPRRSAARRWRKPKDRCARSTRAGATTACARRR